MNLYLIQRYTDFPIMINADPSSWYQLDGETIYFEPGEEAEEVRGTCIMMGCSARFIEIAARQFDMEFDERCYVLSHHQPIVKRISPNTRIVKLSYRSVFERTHDIYKDTRI